MGIYSAVRGGKIHVKGLGHSGRCGLLRQAVTICQCIMGLFVASVVVLGGIRIVECLVSFIF